MKRRRVIALSIFLISLPLCFVGCGHGGESQFSPDTYEHRGVRFLYVPGTDAIAWTWPSKPTRLRIVRFWIEEGYFTPATNASQWDVINVWGSSIIDRKRGSGGAKAFWYRAACNTDENAEKWIAWSRQHPKRAAIVWPRVIELLKRAGNGGDRIPDYWAAARLMTSVEDAVDDTQFDERVDEWNHEFAGQLQQNR